MSRKRLAIVTTHPIQYHAPWFRALSAHPEIDLEVFFCHKATSKEQAEAGFGVEFDWDVSLLDGYSYRFLKNVSARPAVNGFNGLDTPEIKDLIARKCFDAVMVNGWHYKSAWQAMRACWKVGTPVMVRSDSHLHSHRTAIKSLAKWPFYRWFISKLDACLPVGKWSKEYFLDYGASPERIFIVPHVVDTDYFARESARLLPDRIALRAGWGLDFDRVVFLFVGKFVEKKRPMDFVRAIAEAAKSRARVSGLMVGDGPLRRECEEFVREKDGPISFAGFLNQSEIARAYVAADALVLPSDGETWGLVVNEAMACGRPCFVSDHVGCGPDMIVPGRTGYIFPMADTGELARLMRSSTAATSALESMSKQAIKKAEESSVSSGVEKVIEAIDTLASGRMD